VKVFHDSVQSRWRAVVPLICFFGPDGSGKTTLSRDVARRLIAKGFRIKRGWMRGSHTIVSFLSRLLSRFTIFRGGFNPYYGVAVPGSMARLWSVLEYLGALPVILLRFILPCLLGYVVVADRYVLDLMVWITLVTGDEGFLKSILARHLLLLASRAGPVFFVTASPEELAGRRGGELNVLERQNRLYETIRRRAYIIDTTGRTPSESLEEVLEVLENHGWMRDR